MASVAAVSSGEILDVVAAPPAPRGDSGSSADRFEDVLAGASQELGSEGTVPAAPAVPPGRGKESQGEAAPAKPQGPEKPATQRDDAADAAASNGKEPAPASSSEGNPGAPGGQAGEEEETAVPTATEDEEAVPSQAQAVLFLSQLVVAAVYGPVQAMDGVSAREGDGNGLKLAAPSAAPSAQGQGDPGQALLAVDFGVLPEDWADGQAPAAPQAVGEAVRQAAAGAVLTGEGEGTALAPLQTDAADEAPELATQPVVLAEEDLSALAGEGEGLSPLAEEGDLPPGAAPLPGDGSLPEEGATVVTARGARAIVPEAAPEETAGETAVQSTAVSVNGGKEQAGGARQVDWTRWADAEGADGDEASRPAVLVSAPAAAAAAPAGEDAIEGGFGRSAAGDDEPGGDLLTGRQAAPPVTPEAQPKDAPAAARAGQPVDPSLRAEIHRQVMEATLSHMSIVVREGMAQARIQLEPPSLGRMHMELRMQDGAMSAKVTVETAVAKDAVMSGLRELRESLQRQGVSLESFSVDVRAGLNAGSFGQDRAANPGDGALYLEALPEDEAAAQAPDRPVFASSSLSGDGSINIFA